MPIDGFLVHAAIAGVGVALAAGPLGCFIVWRRMAYFGDTIAHSGLLGVAAGLLLGIEPIIGVIAVAVMLALVLIGIERRSGLPADTLLGILSHSALAIGLVAASLAAGARLDLLSYLFGDILAVTMADIAWVWLGGAAALAALCLLWRPLILVSVHEEIALSEGVNVRLVRAAFMLLIALIVAVAMKIVGVLLITALMIIPAASARPLARTPEAMAALASAIGVAAVVLGLAGSYISDAPSGPSIVVAAACLFALSLSGSGLAAALGGRRVERL